MPFKHHTQATNLSRHAYLILQGLERPDEEEVEQTAAETQAALDKVLTRKLAATNPTTLPGGPGGPQYIKYTPAQQSAAHNSGAGQRIIKMQDMAVDPLEPPKFRHVKVPRGPGSPPVPVMHSPPRPVTAVDQGNWKIPPCISNWKNAKVCVFFWGGGVLRKGGCSVCAV
jgi:SNW domain-containing protein 1